GIHRVDHRYRTGHLRHHEDRPWRSHPRHRPHRAGPDHRPRRLFDPERV
ncbi:MAG: hypothetical protein AVDCRST_MAG50-174, partial [uncultured Acidimicrobiales bacterium]